MIEIFTPLPLSFPYGLIIINDYRHLSFFFCNASLLDYFLTILFSSGFFSFYLAPSFLNPPELPSTSFSAFILASKCDTPAEIYIDCKFFPTVLVNAVHDLNVLQIHTVGAAKLKSTPGEDRAGILPYNEIEIYKTCILPYLAVDGEKLNSTQILWTNKISLNMSKKSDLTYLFSLADRWTFLPLRPTNRLSRLGGPDNPKICKHSQISKQNGGVR